MHINSLKQNEGKSDVPVPITYRQIEGLRRIAEAHAKILLKSEVDLDDAKAAEKVFNGYLADIKFDINGQNTDCSKQKTDVKLTIKTTLKNLQNGLYRSGVPLQLLVQELEAKNIKDANKAVLAMHRAGEIMESTSGHYVLLS
jgi:replicative DNA helicase Mcm